MSIVAAELKAYRSVVVNDTGANGGIMSSSEAVSGASTNLFPNASAQERANGATHYRKLFFKVANADNLSLVNARVWQDSNTEASDKVVFFPATQRNTQSDISGSETKYGMGLLAVGVTAGGRSLQVDTEDGTQVIFRNGDLVRISNRANPNAAGDEFWARIDQSPSVSGNIVTIHTDTGVPVNFLSGTKVSSVYEVSQVVAFAGDAVPSSLNGTLHASWPSYLTFSDIGGIEQNWTLTFTSATAFDITGDTIGYVGAGNTSSGAAPVNGAFGLPYFTIVSTFFAGSWLAGDTVTFTTHPASVPLWLRRIIVAGSPAVSNNTMSLYIDGETT